MLSVVVIAKNEEETIRTCLESIKWVGELVVIDNGSTDKTIEVAKKYTDKVYTKESDDFSEIRNFGFEKTKGEWVLYVDSDERMLVDLREEVEALISRNDQFSAYAVSRKNIIFGKVVNYGPYKKDWVIRLLKRSAFEGWVGKVHEYPKFKGKLGYTKNSFLHLTHRNVDQFILKSLEWSKIDAKLRMDSGHPKMTGWRFIRIFISELLNQGIQRKGFFGGTIGIIDSILQTFSLYMTYVRLWQFQQKDYDDVYKKIDKKLLESEFKDV